MIKLKLNFSRTGVSYTQVKKGKRSCIYEKKFMDNVVYWEVFRIKITPVKKINGNLLESKEVYPSNEAFGRWAWTFRTLEEANERFNQLEMS